MRTFVCPKCKRETETLAREAWCPCRLSDAKPQSTLMKEVKVPRAILGDVPAESIVDHG